MCLEPLAGHTPGHVSVRMVSDGEAAVAIGDTPRHTALVERAGHTFRFAFDHF